MNRYDGHDMLAARFQGFLLGLIAACAVLASHGCARPAVTKPQLAGVLPVAVVSWPSPIKPKCEIPDLDEVPDIFLWTKLTEEDAGRIYITQRQLADLVVWMKDVRHWGGQATKCLRALTEAP